MSAQTIGFCIIAIETLVLVFVLWRRRVKKPKNELVEQLDRIIYASKQVSKPAVRGACGVTGCKNQRPHSHVADLVRRLKEDKK